MKTLKGFIKQLDEEKNVHMEHLEDLIFNEGVDGTRKAINFLRDLRDMLAGNSSSKVTATVKDSYGIYTTIKAGKTSPEVEVVVSKVKSKSTNMAIKSGTPKTITSFFNRTIADQLNGDPKSIQYLIEVLAGKDFYQANLNIDKWRAGEILYKISKSGKASLVIIGSKSAINDIEARQGLVNYELKVQ